MENKTNNEYPILIAVPEELVTKIEAYKYNLDAYDIMVKQCTGNNNSDVPSLGAENFRILLQEYQKAFTEFNVAFAEVAKIVAPEYPMNDYIINLDFSSKIFSIFPRGFQKAGCCNDSCDCKKEE